MLLGQLGSGCSPGMTPLTSSGKLLGSGRFRMTPAHHMASFGSQRSDGLTPGFKEIQTPSHLWPSTPSPLAAPHLSAHWAAAKKAAVVSSVLRAMSSNGSQQPQPQQLQQLPQQQQQQQQPKRGGQPQPASSSSMGAGGPPVPPQPTSFQSQQRQSPPRERPQQPPQPSMPQQDPWSGMHGGRDEGRGAGQRLRVPTPPAPPQPPMSTALGASGAGPTYSRERLLGAKEILQKAGQLNEGCGIRLLHVPNFDMGGVSRERRGHREERDRDRERGDRRDGGREERRERRDRGGTQDSPARERPPLADSDQRAAPSASTQDEEKPKEEKKANCPSQ